jgi:hypothetical protein
MVATPAAFLPLTTTLKRLGATEAMSAASSFRDGPTVGT